MYLDKEYTGSKTTGESVDEDETIDPIYIHPNGVNDAKLVTLWDAAHGGEW